MFNQLPTFINKMFTFVRTPLPSGTLSTTSPTQGPYSGLWLYQESPPHHRRPLSSGKRSFGLWGPRRCCVWGPWRATQLRSGPSLIFKQLRTYHTIALLCALGGTPLPCSRLCLRPHSGLSLQTYLGLMGNVYKSCWFTFSLGCTTYFSFFFFFLRFFLFFFGSSYFFSACCSNNWYWVVGLFD